MKILKKKISLDRYKMGKNVKKLDDLFIFYLKDKYSLKKNMYNKK